MARQPWKRATGKTFRRDGYKATNNKKTIIRRAARPQIQSAALVRLRRNDFGFPDSMVTKFKFSDIGALTSAAGVIANYTYRLNSCFDPDLSGSGHQPMWYDQFLGASAGSAPYKNYRVLSSKMNVTFSFTTAPAVAALNHGPCLVGIIPSTSSSLLATTSSAIMETDVSSTRILCDKSGANNIKKCYASYNPQRDLALDTGDDTISALYNASPSQVYYAHVFKLDSTGTSTVYYYVNMEFVVELFQRNEVAQS